MPDLGRRATVFGSPGLSLGAATSRAGERLEDVVKRADLLIFDAKRTHYAVPDAVPGSDRRRDGVA